MQAHFGDRMPYVYAIHTPQSTTEPGRHQPHLHVLWSTRQLDTYEREHGRRPAQFFRRYDHQYPERGGAPKSPAWNHLGNIKAARVLTSDIINLYLERYGQGVRIHPERLQVRGFTRPPEPRVDVADSNALKFRKEITTKMQRVLDHRQQYAGDREREQTQARHYWQAREQELGISPAMTLRERVDRARQARERAVWERPGREAAQRTREPEQARERTAEWHREPEPERVLAPPVSPPLVVQAMLPGTSEEFFRGPDARWAETRGMPGVSADSEGSRNSSPRENFSPTRVPDHLRAQDIVAGNNISPQVPTMDAPAGAQEPTRQPWYTRVRESFMSSGVGEYLATKILVRILPHWVSRPLLGLVRALDAPSSPVRAGPDRSVQPEHQARDGPQRERVRDGPQRTREPWDHQAWLRGVQERRERNEAITRERLARLPERDQDRPRDRWGRGRAPERDEGRDRGGYSW
jgi:hypothetical protein